ncbi:MAG: DUF6089 family protein [Bacteroidales bacterium]|nr:DUF6089 family protein [Bacteroidales bacterium]
MKKAIALFVVALFVVSGVFAQTTTSWKASRHSVYAGIGGNIFEGDIVSPKNKKAISFKDAGFSAQLGYKFKLTERFSLRANMLYANLAAADDDSKRESHVPRNLDFKTNAWNLDGIVDFYFIKEKEFKNHFVPSFTQRLSAYVFVGFGGLFYNPKGSYNGDWYELRPLHTEGQGQPGREDEYGKVTWVLPLGVGAKFSLTKKLYVGIELAQHFTGSDYIDDCSSTYFQYSPSEVPSYNLADKTPHHNMKTGAQRGGNSHNDCFKTFLVTFGYKFTGGPTTEHVARPKYIY